MADFWMGGIRWQPRKDTRLLVYLSSGCDSTLGAPYEYFLNSEKSTMPGLQNAERLPAEGPEDELKRKMVLTCLVVLALSSACGLLYSFKKDV